MTTLYLRKLTLLVGPGDGTGIDLSEFHVVFTVKHGVVSTPKYAAIRVYNLAADTAKTISTYVPPSDGAVNPSTNRSQVILQAGYETGQFGLLFQGAIRQVRRGRESPVDTFTDIYGVDSSIAHTFAVVNKTLGAGYSAADAWTASVDAMKAHDVTSGPVPDGLSQQAMPRGKTCYGLARDTLHDTCVSNGLTWTIENSEVRALPVNGNFPGTAIELNSTSGMIGMPTQTQDGIVVRSLLNPAIRAGTLLNINEQSIIQAQLSPAYTATNVLPSLDANGVYRVWFVDHSGDTRGQEWYSDMTCEGADPTSIIPPSSAVKEAELD